VAPFAFSPGFPNESVFRYERQAIGAAGKIDWKRLAPLKEVAN
jgi:hypothetical protein